MNLLRKREAFTLIEIVIAISLVVGLMAIIYPIIRNFQKDAARGKISIAMGVIQQSLLRYNMDMGRYPTTREGLETLFTPPQPKGRWNGPYLDNVSQIEKIEYKTGNEIENKEYRNYELFHPGDGNPIVKGE